MSRTFSIITFLLAFSSFTYAQETGEATAWKRNRLLLAIGHMVVGQGIDDAGNRSTLALPAWMIDYDYSLSRKWSVGLHNDIITENFKVEGYFLHEETTSIERVRPIASVVAVAFKVGRHSVYSFGTGGEFSSEGNYFVTRLGFEYGFELPGEWELCPAVAYDLKWDAYDSISISLGVGKKF